MLALNVLYMSGTVYKYGFYIFSPKKIMMCFLLLLNIDSPVPFAVDGSTSELVVTAPVDREEKEVYQLLIVCTIQTEEMVDTLFDPLHVNIYDEDDNPPYLNGTDTEEVIIEFNRSEVHLHNILFVKCSRCKCNHLMFIESYTKSCTVFSFNRALSVDLYLFTTETRLQSIPATKVKINLLGPY